MFQKGEEPIPGYRLEKLLGRGQYGEVWRVRAPGDLKMAFKFISLSGQAGAKELRGVLRVKDIRHPHLMPITGIWVLNEDYHIMPWSDVLEDSAEQQKTMGSRFGAGGNRPNWLVVGMSLGDMNLAERLEEERKKHRHSSSGEPDTTVGIPANDLLRYMEEAAKGIDFLNLRKHDLGEVPVTIQHCDIKPANIMLVGDSVQICDYGLARILGDQALLSLSAGMVGTPAYMAPETIRPGRPCQTSDQYSLAITYYELRTGNLPFREETPMGVLQAHLDGKLVLDDLHPFEQEVIQKATSIDPDARFPSSQEMVYHLRLAVLRESGKPSDSVVPPLTSGGTQTPPASHSAAESAPEVATAAPEVAVETAGGDVEQSQQTAYPGSADQTVVPADAVPPPVSTGDTAVPQKEIQHTTAEKPSDTVAPGHMPVPGGTLMPDAPPVSLTQEAPEDVVPEVAAVKRSGGFGKVIAAVVVLALVGGVAAAMSYGPVRSQLMAWVFPPKPVTPPNGGGEKKKEGEKQGGKKKEGGEQPVTPVLPDLAELREQLTNVEKLLNESASVDPRVETYCTQVAEAIATVPESERLSYEPYARWTELVRIRCELRRHQPPWSQELQDRLRDWQPVAQGLDDQKFHHEVLSLLVDGWSRQASGADALTLVDSDRLSRLSPRRDAFDPWEEEQLLTLLLMQATRQAGADEFADAAKTLDLASAWATVSEDRRKINELLAQIQLEDRDIDIVQAAKLLEQVLPMTRRKSEFCELLRERVSEISDPAVLDELVRVVARLRTAVPGLPEELDGVYADLFERYLRQRVYDPTFDPVEWFERCDEVRQLARPLPLVNACWVEARVAQDGQEQRLSQRDWLLFNERLTTALEASDELPEADRAYGLFVQALVDHQLGQTRTAAARLHEIGESGMALMKSPWRKERAETILFADARDAGIPTDDQFGDPRGDVQRVYRDMQLLSSWSEDLPDQARAWWVAAALYASDELPVDWDAVRDVSEALLADRQRGQWLMDEKLLATVTLANALGWARGEDASSRERALPRIAWLAENAPSMTPVEPLDLYERVVAPAVAVLDEQPLSPEASEEVRRAAATVYATQGDLILHETRVEQFVRRQHEGADPMRVALDAYEAATRLAPRAEYYARQGQVLARLPYADRRDYLNKLEELVAAARELDANHPEVLLLQGYTMQLAAHELPFSAERLGLLEQALETYRNILQASSLQDHVRAMCYEQLSNVALEAAILSFHAEQWEAHKRHLEEAEASAREAIAIEHRPFRENAFACLGNALEDRALYLNQYDQYGQAVEQFRAAVGEAMKADRPAALFYFHLGRAQIRQALSGNVAGRDKLLETAKQNLEIARNVWLAELEQLEQDSTKDYIAEAAYWISEVDLARAVDRREAEDVDEAMRLFAEADRVRREAVEQARAIRSLKWPEFQVGWVYIPCLQWKVSGEAQPEIAQQAHMRAEELFAQYENQGTESVENLGIPIPRSALLTTLKYLLEMDEDVDRQLELLNDRLRFFPSEGDGRLDRAEVLLLQATTVNRHMNELMQRGSWPAYRERLMASLEEMDEILAPGGSGDGQRGRYLTGRAGFLRGFVEFADYLMTEQQALANAALWDEARRHLDTARRHLQQAVEAFGPNLGESRDPSFSRYPTNVQTRLLLATVDLRYVRALRGRQLLTPEEEAAVKKEIQDVLEPISDETADERDVRRAEELREAAQ